MIRFVAKSYGYVLRETEQGLEVLVFRHRDFPEAGVQVPGGTLDEGETPHQGVLREIEEEAGLKGLEVVRMLEPIPFRSGVYQEWQLRHFAVLRAPENCPETWTYTVSHGERDKDLVFIYEWWPVERAARELAGGKGHGLHVILKGE